MGHHYKCTSVCMLQDDESTDLHSAAVSHSLIYRYLHRHSMHIIKTKLSIYHVCMYTIPQTGWAVCRYVYTKYITSKVNLLSTHWWPSLCMLVQWWRLHCISLQPPCITMQKTLACTKDYECAIPIFSDDLARKYLHMHGLFFGCQ